MTVSKPFARLLHDRLQGQGIRGLLDKHQVLAHGHYARQRSARGH